MFRRHQLLLFLLILYIRTLQISEIIIIHILVQVLVQAHIPFHMSVKIMSIVMRITTIQTSVKPIIAIQPKILLTEQQQMGNILNPHTSSKNNKNQTFYKKINNLEQQNKHLIEIIKNLSETIKLSSESLNYVILKDQIHSKTIYNQAMQSNPKAQQNLKLQINQMENVQNSNDQTIKQIQIFTKDDYKMQALVSFKKVDQIKNETEMMMKMDQLLNDEQILINFIVVTKIQYLASKSKSELILSLDPQIVIKNISIQNQLNYKNQWLFNNLIKQDFVFLYPKLIIINKSQIQEVVSQISTKLVQNVSKMLKWKSFKNQSKLKTSGKVSKMGNIQEQIWIGLDQNFKTINKQLFLIKKTNQKQKIKMQLLLQQSQLPQIIEM